jgi:hypothetical protein
VDFYVLALGAGPDLHDPLISDYGPGTNSALQSDVLTVSTHTSRSIEYKSMWGRLEDMHSTIAPRMTCDIFITDPCL